jgi:hypothetical protein
MAAIALLLFFIGTEITGQFVKTQNKQLRVFRLIKIK